MKIVSTAPVRLDFNGGGTDVNPFAATFGGTVVNATINRGYRAVLTPRRDTLVEVIDKERRVFDLKIPLTYGEDVHFDLIRAILNYFRDKIVTGFTLIIHSDIEDSAGLGSSACFTVTVLGAMCQFLPRSVSKDEVARLAFELETKELGWVGGKQDQWCAAYGGLNLMEFGPGERVSVRSLKLGKMAYKKFQNWLIVFYTGGKRKSSDLQIQLQKNMEAEGRIEAFQKMKQLACETALSLEQGDIEAVGNLIDLGWQEKKHSNPLISNERIDGLYSAARRQGALGGQLAGAGQVGYLFFLCPPQKQTAVCVVLERLGARKVDFILSKRGLKVSRQ